MARFGNFFYFVANLLTFGAPKLTNNRYANKLGQIYIKWYIETQILGYLYACLVVTVRVRVYCENMDLLRCTHFQKGSFQVLRVVVYPVLKCVGIVLVSLHIARWI